ncbi:MAG TPA: D-2-hydroxyacid dehydrogenase [Candidatus Binatia bacterium]|nr:D-2-hydroxyacid dehydrogenase [Candidatus Binatia bacterium]
MPLLLTTHRFLANYGERLRRICTATNFPLEPVTLPHDVEQRLAPATLDRIEIVCFTGTFEADPVFTRRFLGSALRAPNLRWMHLPNAGVDHPVFGRFLERGVRLTNSAGAAAEPIAQTAIGGILALARGFPRWWAAQRRHEWSPHPHAPRELRGQTMVLVGVGAIGNEIARLARALNLHVIGIRRRPQTASDHVDELHPPSALRTLLPRADWLVLACPLTDETRRLIDAAALARLPGTARVVNVGRGQVIDEAALIAALQAGRLAGAYLDVFETEPLPADSPLWDLPNVIISPHNSSVSTGNSARVSELFLRNLEHWARREPLENEVHAQ